SQKVHQGMPFRVGSLLSSAKTFTLGSPVKKRGTVVTNGSPRTSSGETFTNVKSEAAALRGRPLQFLRRLQRQRMEPFSVAFVQGREEFLAHAGLPEFLDVIGHAVERLVVRIGLEKLGDLVRHADQSVGLHGPPRPPGLRTPRDHRLAGSAGACAPRAQAPT